MLDLKSLQTYLPGAQVAFGKQLADKVCFIATRCWQSNLKGHLKELNELLVAAKASSVITDGSLFTDDEIEQLLAYVGPARTLNMAKEIIEVLIEALGQKQVQGAYLEQVRETFTKKYVPADN